jgi:diguanylate cyclase (GGDEF)-like protein/PAS domain S-box-containing protein
MDVNQVGGGLAAQPEPAPHAPDPAILYAGILEHMQGGVVVIDLQGRVQAFNPAAEQMLGLPGDRAREQSFGSLFLGDPANDGFAQAVLDAIYEPGDRHNRDIEFHRGDRSIWLNLTTSVLWSRPAPGGMPRKVGVVALFINITQRKLAEEALHRANTELEQRVQERTRELHEANHSLQAEIAERIRVQEELAHLAEHDALTGLPNRRLFEHRLTIAAAGDKGFALLYLDLDGFKAVNDTHGHDVGDWLLRSVARRLESCVREGDTVARLGGDEFAIVLESANEPEDALVVAQRIIAHISEPYHGLGEIRLRIGVSVGVALHPRAGWALDDLLQAADAAMYSAKRAGRGTWRIAPDAEG